MNHRQRAARNRQAKRLTFVRPRLEELECRLNPSFAPGVVVSLELVALHEFGHALGLQHITSGPSIMNPNYDGDYNIDAFLNGADPAVAQLQALYSGDNILAGLSPWRDAEDANPGNNAIDLSYSVSSSFYVVMNQQFRDPAMWQAVLARVADYWSTASGGTLTISLANGDLPAGYRGNIRIGASSMDGPGGVLARAAEPPSGEITFDADENWGGKVMVIFADDVRADDVHTESEALMGPVSNLPRNFIAIHEASRDLQTITVFSDLNPIRVIQVQVDQPAAIPQPAPVFVANVGWGQHSQADLYKVVFLPVLPVESQPEAPEVLPDVVAPRQPGNEARPDPTAAVTNDPAVQTQTLQLPAQNRESLPEDQNDEVSVSTVFDAGTALAGLALFMGSYWAVPEEERKEFLR